MAPPDLVSEQPYYFLIKAAILRRCSESFEVNMDCQKYTAAAALKWVFAVIAVKTPHKSGQSKAHRPLKQAWTESVLHAPPCLSTCNQAFSLPALSPPLLFTFNYLAKPWGLSPVLWANQRPPRSTYLSSDQSQQGSANEPSADWFSSNRWDWCWTGELGSVEGATVVK